MASALALQCYEDPMLGALVNEFIELVFTCDGSEFFFRSKIYSILNYKYNCDNDVSISSVFLQFKSVSFHVSFLSRVKMNSINWSAPNIWIFIAQLVEHCSANEAILGSSQNYYTRTGPTKPQNSWWCLPAPPLLNVKRWCLCCIATPLSSSRKLQ